MIQGPLQWAIVKDKPLIRDGDLFLPDQPGLGVEIEDELEAKFPYISGGWGLPVQRKDVVVGR
jgi:L-alanine-DL-glutamate epimerase-like enolase superfamily enzyme